MDDEYSFSEKELALHPVEARLIDRVSAVFIHSPALLDKKGRINPETHFIPNGVDFAAHATPSREPIDLQRIPHPRLGYSGYVKHQLDFELLERLISAHPEWSFVFVGAAKPGQAEVSAVSLNRSPNVHFLGAKPVDVLARYTQHFEVCLMPYTVNDYTKFIYPMKLHEYLAGGRPTVGVPIPAVVPFSDVIELASTVEDWEGAIKRCLEPGEDSEARRRERQSVARAHDWDMITGVVAGHMARIAFPEKAHLVEDAVREQFPDAAGVGFSR